MALWQTGNKPLPEAIMTLQWRYNERDGVSDHQPHDCLLNHLFGCRSEKTSKLQVTGLCAGNSPVTGEFPAQRASNAENVSIRRRHHDLGWCIYPSVDIDKFTAWEVITPLTYNAESWWSKSTTKLYFMTQIFCLFYIWISFRHVPLGTPDKIYRYLIVGWALVILEEWNGLLGIHCSWYKRLKQI